MAWIELHDTLPRNKKIVRLKRQLKIKTAQAVGHVCLLWLWAVNNAEDGDLRDLDNEDIAEIADWPKDAETFVKALADVGFLDKKEDGYSLHDWSEYAGRLLEQREITREQTKLRQQKRRQKLRDAALSAALSERDKHRDGNAYVTRDGNAYVTDASRVSNAHTIPYHTKPNLTKPNHKENSFLSDERKEPKESPSDPVLSQNNRLISLVDPPLVISGYETWLMQSRGWTTQDIVNEREKRGVERLEQPKREGEQ